MVSGSGAQQEGLCSTLTRGRPVDWRMEMEMEIECRASNELFASRAVQAQKSPG